MAAKIIKYIPKNTAAGTEYREISDDDKQVILTACVQALTIMAEYDRAASDDEDKLWIREKWWHKKDKRLHKGKDGMNTPCSTVGGIVHNMMFKTPLQRDLSAKQMEDIEFIFQCLHSFYPDIQPFRFQIGFSN